MKKKLVVFGGGPHCKVVLDLLLHSDEYEVVGVVDKDGNAPFGVPVIEIAPFYYSKGNYYDGRHEEITIRFEGTEEQWNNAVGSNRVRKKLGTAAIAAGLDFVTIIAPDAVVSEFSEIGKGVLINHGAVVNAGAVIGDGTILNTCSSVDHDCRVGGYCHIAPGVHISGSTSIGEATFLGTGSSVIDGINIGREVMVGAGAAVVKDLPDCCTAVGVPAKVIKFKEGHK